MNVPAQIKHILDNAKDLFSLPIPNSNPLTTTRTAFKSTEETPQHQFALQTKNWQPSPSLTNATILKSNSSSTAKAIKLHQKEPANLNTTQSKYTINNNTEQKLFVGHMRPRNRALNYVASDKLLRYATNGCPVDCGPD